MWRSERWCNIQPCVETELSNVAVQWTSAWPLTILIFSRGAVFLLNSHQPQSTPNLFTLHRRHCFHYSDTFFLWRRFNFICLNWLLCFPSYNASIHNSCLFWFHKFIIAAIISVVTEFSIQFPPRQHVILHWASLIVPVHNEPVQTFTFSTHFFGPVIGPPKIPLHHLSHLSGIAVDVPSLDLNTINKRKTWGKLFCLCTLFCKQLRLTILLRFWKAFHTPLSV